jgi:hypothetical protein
VVRVHVNACSVRHPILSVILLFWSLSRYEPAEESQQAETVFDEPWDCKRYKYFHVAGTIAGCRCLGTKRLAVDTNESATDAARNSPFFGSHSRALGPASTSTVRAFANTVRVWFVILTNKALLGFRAIQHLNDELMHLDDAKITLCWMELCFARK